MRNKTLNSPGPWTGFRSILFTLVAAAFLTHFASLNAATLSGSFTPLPNPTNINLTAEGTLDWVHWGHSGPWSLERKYGVVQQISNTFLVTFDYIYVFGPYQLQGNALAFNWSDGTPSPIVYNATNYVGISGGKIKGNPTGYQIQCAADTSPKQLRLYLGTSGITGNLNASLSGASGYSDTSLSGGSSNGVYTISFQAESPGQILTVTFTSGDSAGYLSLYAATLNGTNNPPSAALLQPTNNSVYVAPAAFELTASATDEDGTVTNLTVFNGLTLLAQTNTGTLNMMVSNQPAGSYKLVAVATDNTGLSITSRPANVFITTGGGVLSGSVATPPATLNLTTNGPYDWAHWGLYSGNDFDHKANVSRLIPNVTPFNATTNDFLQYADNLTAYEWSDGTPTLAASYSTTGIFLYSTNQPPGAFQLTVPATNALRRLKVYVGLYGAQARMDAWMSDSSAVSYSDESLSSVYDNAYAAYTFIYSSTNTGATLNVRWSPTLIFDRYYGNVTWQAATMSAPPPAPALTLISPLQADGFNFSFPTQSGANYTVCYSDSLNPPNWQVLTNFPGFDADATINDTKTGVNTRFYRVQAQ